MTSQNGLVLDANILLRAVFGRRVMQIMRTYKDSAAFCTADVCFLEAQKYIPSIAERSGHTLQSAFTKLDEISLLVQPVDLALYGKFEHSARYRIASRDPDDWPVVATALLLNVPIWTEDQDFFGTGIPTWTTDRVEIYLKS